MKVANLISLAAAYSSLDSVLLKQYLNYHSIDIKHEEIGDLYSLVTELRSLNKQSSIFDKYFIGYRIPQISKEFDLLRIGQNYIVNIELKSNAELDRIKKQLIQNKYYLSFLNKPLYFFTFTSKTKRLFTLDSSDNLVETSYDNLLSVLGNQIVDPVKEINTLFNPSNYLVSPFNSTDNFILGKYFLTVHQAKMKDDILSILNSQNGISLAIKGKAGTGKTLLTYDIAKELITQQKKVLIIHCGKLNYGHIKLSTEFKWNILPPKSISGIDFSQYYLIIIDEAQRIYSSQLKHIIDNIKSYSGKCIFSYDGQQCLAKWEIDNNTEQQIEKIICHAPFVLSEKIRSNKEIADFLNPFFDMKKQIVRRNYPNIELKYFNRIDDAKSFMMQQKLDNWKIIHYTSDTKRHMPYDLHKIDFENDNAHTVIGQEFDKVIAVVDEHFYYNNGKLDTKGYISFYHPTKMLFQIVTRTRIKLGIVVINNKEVLEHCLRILNPPEFL